VPECAIVVGVPARIVGDMREKEGNRSVTVPEGPDRAAVFGVLAGRASYARETVEAR
jgi:hypothetical protein